MRTPRGQEARARDRIRGSIIPSSLGIDRAERSSERPVESADESGPQPASLPAFFEASVDLGPDRPAVIVGDQHTTYAELEARANQLARYLLARGIGRGSRVAILLDRSVDLYVAILGTLKSGAAYVPLDPGYPADRVGFVVEDAGVRAVLTTSERVSSYATKIPTILLDVEAPRIQRESPTRPGPSEADVGPEDLCYIIYTSGSTGRPKGVAVEHRNITHWVQAARTVYGITAEDRVYQGFSVAFDASLEEIWMAWANGAALVPATPEMSRAGPDLPKLLAAAGVTFLSTVPTLASMFTDDIPSVRLLVFGGERCPDATAHRWCRPGRRVLNTYGPTEATVTATYAECRPGEPVTIGRAMPGYELYVLDESLERVAPGEPGELCIGGPGVARGYVNRDDLTRERFIPNPFPDDRADAPRIYRTGDLVRATESGELQFLGRTDDQVKIRGYRVELSEIEAQILAAPGIRAAAVDVREMTPGIESLVAYVVPADPREEPDWPTIQGRLREVLPPYMIPSHCETIDEVPTRSNGKVDRKRLPAPRLRDARPAARDGTDERTETERGLLDVLARLFRPQPVSVDDDFFLDLGGHSLLAARAVTALRKAPGFERVSMTDLYEHPTIRSLARAIDATRTEAPPARTRPRRPVPAESPSDRRRRILAGAVQGLSLYVVFGTRCLAWITPYVVFFLLLLSGHSLLASAGWAIASEAAVFPALFLFVIAAKWIVLGRVRPGRYPLWGRYHLRFWFVQALVGALPLGLLTGTPLLPFVYRLLGARIGRDVFLGTDRFGAYDLISIGEGSSINELASVNGYSIEGGELVLAPIAIGRGCFVGTWSVVGQDCVMGDYARLEDLSLLPRGTTVPAGDTWRGSPARRTTPERRAPPPPPRQSRIRKAVTAVAYAALVTVYPILFFLVILPAMIVLAPTGFLQNPGGYIVGAPLAAAYFVAGFAAVVVLVKWTVLGRVRPGTYPVHGGFYVRHWFVEHLVRDSREFMGQVYATLYAGPWYRALGAKIGRNVELSTAASVTPDLLELADGSTVADEVSLGAPHVEGGWITLAPTRLGRRAFIGNSGVVPAGTTLGERSLVGVLSIAPSDPTEAGREGASWLGSPPIPLPRREPSASFSEARTYRPTRKRKLARGLFELLRITGPTAGLFLVASFVTSVVLTLFERVGIVTSLLLIPAIYAAACLAAIGAVALVKWAVVGRYKPFTRPLWSNLVWRLEFVNALYEFFAAPIALEALAGTPFLPAYLRLLGAKIGRGAYIETTGFLEWDLVEVGDRSVLMEDAVVQTHLFEDRVLKASRLRIGNDCSIGDAAVVLYDSHLEDGSRLDALSLVMKGETLPAGTAWAGVPAAWQSPAPVRSKDDEWAASAATARGHRLRPEPEPRGRPARAQRAPPPGLDD